MIEFHAEKVEIESGFKSKVTVDDIRNSVWHVCMANGQRTMYNDCIAEARQ